MELKPELGRKIMANLRSLCPEIPHTGVIAGGAIADWLLGLQPNDIDLFVPATEEDQKKRWLGVNTANFGAPEWSFDKYEHTTMGCIAWKRLYQVVSSRTEGLLNTISCSGEHLTAARIISGFDLNATRVGIDLDTETLVWDEDFAYFLKNTQLRVSALFTPAHTAIRYYLKKERYGCLGKDDLEMAIISEAWKNNRLGRFDHELPYQFGKLYLQKAEKALELGLRKFFVIEPSGSFWTLAPKKLPNFDSSELTGIMFPVLAPKALRAQRTVSPIFNKKINDLEYLGKSDFAQAMIRLQGSAYVRGKVTENALAEVERFVGEQRSLSPLFWGLHLERQFQVQRRLERFAKRYEDDWIFGLIQEQATPYDVISDEALKMFVDKFQSYYCEPFKEVDSRVPRNFLWLKINEIVTRKEAYLDREKLGHHVMPNTSEQYVGFNSMMLSIQSRLTGGQSTVKIREHDNCVEKPREHASKTENLPFLHKSALLWILVSLSSTSFWRKLQLFFKYLNDDGIHYYLKDAPKAIESAKSSFVTPSIEQR